VSGPSVLAVLDTVARGCALHADRCVGRTGAGWAEVATTQYEEARAAVADVYAQRDAMAEALRLYAKAGVGNSTDFHIQAQAANAAREAIARVQGGQS